MDLSSAGTWITAVGSLGLLSFAVEAVRTFQAGRQQRAQLALAAAHAPQVAESLLLGSTEKAVAIQAAVIEGLREQVAWQIETIKELRRQLDEKDQRIEALDDRAAALQWQVVLLSRAVPPLPEVGS